MTPYDKLSEREIDVLIGKRLFLWNCYQNDHFSYWEDVDRNLTCLPYYSVNDNAARLVRDRIAELGLQGEFSKLLRKSMKLGVGVHPFFVMQATPKQQAIAALMALDSQTARTEPTIASPEVAAEAHKEE